MKKDLNITNVHAREILDSRGAPTVEATVSLACGISATASSPSGASVGKYEAVELRDGDSLRYKGKGVLKAVENVNGEINSALCGIEADTRKVDTVMLRLDGTENKKRLGSNSILAVSLAVTKAAAAAHGMPLYKYIGGISKVKLPHPMMNILNGGAHASNPLDIQEFMIVPIGFSSFSEKLRAGAEIYHSLGSILCSNAYSTTVGDEGGFAPSIRSAEEALDLIIRAIDDAGYTTEEVKLALDIAASEWAKGRSYDMPKSGEKYSSDELILKWEKLCEAYPIISIEDGLGEDDMSGWAKLTEELGGKCMLVGDDLFVTNEKRLRFGRDTGCGNSILIKPNQIGSVSECLDVVSLAKDSGYKTILSHRSGETVDTSIADLSVALSADFIKAGAPARGERCAKYNRLLRIEEELS